MPKSDSGLTITVNWREIEFWPPLVVPPLSMVTTVTTPVPDWAGDGVKVTLPLEFGLV